MQSREISQNSSMWNFQFSVWLKCSFGELHFAENPTWISPVVPRLWAIEGFFKTKEKNRNLFLFLAVSHNQCCRLLTGPARSQHIRQVYFLETGIWEILNHVYFFKILLHTCKEDSRGVVKRILAHESAQPFPHHCHQRTYQLCKHCFL